MDARVSRRTRNIAIRHSDLAVGGLNARALEENSRQSCIGDDDVVDVHTGHARCLYAPNCCKLAIEYDIAHGDIRGARGNAQQARGGHARSCRIDARRVAGETHLGTQNKRRGTHRVDASGFQSD